MVKIKIKIDKDILQKSSDCKSDYAGRDCAFSVAFRELFPEANVKYYQIFPSQSKLIEWGERTGRSDISVNEAVREKLAFEISKEMTSFIQKFDGSSPEERLQFEEKEFEINIPDWALEHIDITDVKRIIENSPHLELV